MRYLMLGGLVLALGGCANNGSVSIPTAQALDIVAKASTCATAVNAAAVEPVCRAPIQPCTAAYNAGRDAVQAAQ